MNNGSDDTMTLDEVRTMAAERTVPGPDIEEHAENYGGECYCRTCLEYMTDG